MPLRLVWALMRYHTSKDGGGSSMENPLSAPEGADDTPKSPAEKTTGASYVPKSDEKWKRAKHNKCIYFLDFE